MKTLTIFTPTYNREHLLEVLYKSLCEQTNKDFIWIIVDDGSEDNTRKLVNKWILENKIEINYFFQENAGKHVAHNKAVELCNTELFICVDSDDILTKNAVEQIIDRYNNTKNSNIVGYISRKGSLDRLPTGKNWKNDESEISFFDLYEKLKFRGELAIVFISKYLKNYRFPVFKNEKFVTENVLYYQISYNKTVKLINDIFYLFEYKQDGYTKQGEKLYFKNPYGYAVYRKQVALLSKNILKKIKWLARFKAWIMVYELDEKIIDKYLLTLNLKEANSIIDFISSLYSKHYIKTYTSKKNLYYEE